MSATDVERGIKYIVSINADKISLIGQDKNLFDRVHLFFRDTLRKGLNDNEFSTAYGLLIGNTDEMDYDLITPVHRPEKPASSTYKSTSGLSPHEQRESQAEFHSSTQDEA